MQEVFFFFDDSGVLHKKESSGFFVYAGFVFTEREELENAKRKYIHCVKNIKASTGRNDELKASSLSTNHKRALFNSIREYDSVAAVVDIKRIYDYILADKKSICRYKDYIIKRTVKRKLECLIANGLIQKDQDITIHIYIDEQLTATNGYYDLRDSIKEELQYGVANFNYGVRHPNLFDAQVKVDIQYCDSSKNYLIQASDILANRIWTSYARHKPSLRKRMKNHLLLTFP